jgi:predicted ATPase
LALDDLHDADDASIQLVAELSARIHGLPVVVLVGICSDVPARIGGGAFLQEVVSTGTVIDVSPLGTGDMEILTAMLLGGPFAPAIFQVISTLAGGNPHFAQEAAQALRGRGHLRQVHGMWQLDETKPHISGRHFLRGHRAS